MSPSSCLPIGFVDSPQPADNTPLRVVALRHSIRNGGLRDPSPMEFFDQTVSGIRIPHRTEETALQFRRLAFLPSGSW